MTILGLNLRTTSKHSSEVVVLSREGQLRFLGGFKEERELFKIAGTYKPGIIAIGAPITLPSGLCCLEKSCSCDFTSRNMKGRQLELELSKMTIGCFVTNKSSIIRGLIYRGVSLNKQLSIGGYDVIEVYPYASKVLLFGDSVPKKNAASSLPFLRERLAALIDGLDVVSGGLTQGACNAALNAYTGFLHRKKETDILGDSDEGTLVIPKLPS